MFQGEYVASIDVSVIRLWVPFVFTMNTGMEPDGRNGTGSENRIADARGKKGLKQVDLAARIGMTRGQLANIESGTRKVDLPELRRIAGVLGCAVVDLLLPSDAPNNPSPEEAELLAQLRASAAYDARTMLAAVKALIQAVDIVAGVRSVPKSLEGDPSLARAMTERWRGMDDSERKSALALLDTARDFRR